MAQSMADTFLYLSTRSMRTIPIPQMTTPELLEVATEGALCYEDEGDDGDDFMQAVRAELNQRAVESRL